MRQYRIARSGLIADRRSAWRLIPLYSADGKRSPCQEHLLEARKLRTPGRGSLLLVKLESGICQVVKIPWRGQDCLSPFHLVKTRIELLSAESLQKPTCLTPIRTYMAFLGQTDHEKKELWYGKSLGFYSRNQDLEMLGERSESASPPLEIGYGKFKHVWTSEIGDNCTCTPKLPSRGMFLLNALECA